MEPREPGAEVYDYEADYEEDLLYEEAVERQEFWERLLFVAMLATLATLMSAFTGFNYENFILAALYGIAYKIA